MSRAEEIRVLLVDDSPTVRAVLRRLLSKAPDMSVVGDAADGRSAVEATQRLRPDVVLMDITMPELDGFEATTQIMEKAPTAILIFSTEARLDGDRTIFEAYERGARSVLAKPDSPSGWTQLATTLPELVRNVAQDFRDGSPASTAPAAEPEPEADLHPIQVLAVGASTGGPEALRELLAGLAPRPPMAVLVVQHIACEFEEGLADWLRGDLSIDVALARDGERAKPGTIRLAPQGTHLRLEKGGWLRLDQETAPVRSHRPSADVLLSSCAAVAGSKSAGILLSGMGRDGVAGLLEMRRAGGITLVQDRLSSVVHGMPQAALDAGAADLALPPERLAKYVLKSCGVLT